MYTKVYNYFWYISLMYILGTMENFELENRKQLCDTRECL